MNGILAIDKPRGWTSHDVVARVRRLAGQRAVGHAGTLDPMATGVLVVCLGTATRLSDLLMAGTKWYLARVAFGVRTDTDDADGTEVATARPDFSREAMHAALARQVGALMQQPPSFAAIKQGGVPAYKRARAGTPAPLAPRSITVHALALLTSALPAPDQAGESASAVSADLLVGCAKGTYIRAIARDLGEDLGCGAHLAALRRIASGGLTVRNCTTIAVLEAAGAHGGAAAVAAFVRQPELALAAIPACVLGAENALRVANGLTFEGPPVQAGSLRLYDDAGSFLALATATSAGTWHGDRVFAAGRVE